MMTKPYKLLHDKMSPEAIKQAEIKTKQMLLDFLQKQKEEIIEGFKQKSKKFENWEELGLETWNEKK